MNTKHGGKQIFSIDNDDENIANVGIIIIQLLLSSIKIVVKISIFISTSIIFNDDDNIVNVRIIIIELLLLPKL